MKINELAKAANVTADTVRYYVRLGLIQATKDPHNGYRFFSQAALQRLKFIKAAQRLGFKLEEIQLIFDDADKGDSPCPRVRSVIATRIAESAAQIQQLQQMHDRMRHALFEWDQMENGMPDGHSICRLIETRK